MSEHESQRPQDAKSGAMFWRIWEQSTPYLNSRDLAAGPPLHWQEANYPDSTRSWIWLVTVFFWNRSVSRVQVARCYKPDGSEAWNRLSTSIQCPRWNLGCTSAYFIARFSAAWTFHYLRYRYKTLYDRLKVASGMLNLLTSSSTRTSKTPIGCWIHIMAEARLL